MVAGSDTDKAITLGLHRTRVKTAIILVSPVAE
jgi:hypothetical protein